MNRYKNKLRESKYTGKWDKDSDESDEDEEDAEGEIKYKEINMILAEETYNVNKNYLNLIAEKGTLEIANVLWDEKGIYDRDINDEDDTLEDETWKGKGKEKVGK